MSSRISMEEKADRDSSDGAVKVTRIKPRLQVSFDDLKRKGGCGEFDGRPVKLSRKLATCDDAFSVVEKMNGTKGLKMSERTGILLHPDDPRILRAGKVHFYKRNLDEEEHHETSKGSTGFSSGSSTSKNHKKPVIFSERELMENKYEEDVRMLLESGLIPIDWNFDSENLAVKEDIMWFTHSKPPKFSLSKLLEWLKIEPRMISMENEINFVDPSLFKELFELKAAFSKLDRDRWTQARSNSNPCEKIGKGSFVSRAAFKLANIDHITNYELTSPKSNDGESRLKPFELFYFADICAGPGGFTEYILWRKGWEAKGFGMTLKGPLDFQTSNFLNCSDESFETYYGPKNDGDVYSPHNLKGFISHVIAGTDGAGVHLLTADGGFDFEEHVKIQELLTKRIVLSQFAVGFSCVKTGGNFLCKIFDTYTAFTAGLIYLASCCFERIALFKPLSSRPANSERYIICNKKRDEAVTAPIAEYLLHCHLKMFQWSERYGSDWKEDISEVVPLHLLKRMNDPFYDYLIESNDRMAARQILYLKKCGLFYIKPELEDPMQISFKIDCLKAWGIPNDMNKIISLDSLPSKIKRICGEDMEGIQTIKQDWVNPGNFKSIFQSPFDWRVVILGNFEPHDQINGTRGFYFSRKKQVYFYKRGTWSNVSGFVFPNETFLYGEIVTEYSRHSTDQKITSAFHIIDAMQLGHKDIRKFHYAERQLWCHKFAKSISSCSNVVRAKFLFRLEHLKDLLNMVTLKQLKNQGNGVHRVCPISFENIKGSVPLIKPIGVMFLKITKEPWMMALDHQAQRKYYFNSATQKSSYVVPTSAIANFYHTMDNRYTWKWNEDTNIVVDSLVEPTNLTQTHAADFMKLIQKAFASNEKESEESNSGKAKQL